MNTTARSLNTEHELFRDYVLEWSEGQLRQFPWRETTEPYKILLAEILLQQTPAERVEPVYNDVLERYGDLTSIGQADLEELTAIIKPLGLQNQRAQALIEIGEQLGEKGVPQNESKLLELPYVGKYVANATLCFAFGQPRAVADSNIIRVYERAFDRELHFKHSDTWEFAQLLLPEDNARRYNLAVIDFADAVCTVEAPSCEECFFSEKCEYYQNTLIGANEE